MAEGGFYAGKGKGGKGGGKAAAAGAGQAPQAPSSLPAALARKLEALNFPDMGSASLNGQEYCKIVLWLEEEKIRLYEKIDRKVLREFNKAWYSHVQDYCRELGIDATGLEEKNATIKLRILNALTNLAVHDVYRDKVEANELTLAPPPAGAGDKADKRRLQHLIAPMNRLLDSFCLPKLPEDAADSDTVAALKCIHIRCCPPADGGAEPLDLDTLPVGLDIADPEVKRAAAVLRVLHGIELQQLQVNINQVINDLQQLTADPKTDARLGRVGR
eukprot:gnl/TRDRNA2_/TRDRNA2_80068_c0_seq1.p1 gnl/TRDRNA2_/TRDRNA2_80068_c0~~gnl/TRDRNA2_/TRDRNA2_80068_c0_seq1.p1  ORF type:complete len:274 (-),score=74.18 gnl/TRDRNA2_/TRDRNA2_80068_c0_seq1:203-1024(-)